MLLDLIDSHSARIATVENLISTAYKITLDLSENLDVLREERECLNVTLGELAAKNCSLRKKDFHAFMEKIFLDIDKEKNKLLERSKIIKKAIDLYLDEQRKSTSLLKQSVEEYFNSNSDKTKLELFIKDRKPFFQERGEKIFFILRDFLYKSQSYKKQMEELNNILRRLVGRGDSLKIEDIRQLNAVRERVAREADRNIRREKVKSMLLQFRQKRLI